MRRWMYVIVALVLISSVLAQEAPQITDVSQIEDDCIYYFYGDECLDCERATELMLNLKTRLPDLHIQTYEVYLNRQNYHTLQQYYLSYNVPFESRGLPVAFTSKSYLVGEPAIASLIEQQIIDNNDPTCPSTSAVKAIGIVGENQPSNIQDFLTFTNVTKEALQDMLRPVMIALWLLILGVLLAIKDPEEGLKRGLLYAFGVFIGYCLFAIGMYGWLARVNIGIVFYKIIGGFSVLIGILGMKWFINTKHKFFKNLSPKVTKELRHIVHLIISPIGITVLGLVASLFTFYNTDLIFRGMRTLVAEQVTRWSVIPQALYYIILVLLPIIAISLILYYVRDNLEEVVKKKKGKHDTWAKHFEGVVGFTIGCVMLIFGLLILIL